MQRASEFSGEQNLNGIQPERPSSSQCTPPLSQPHGVVSEARFSHGRSDGQPSSEGWLGSPRLRLFRDVLGISKVGQRPIPAAGGGAGAAEDVSKHGSKFLDTQRREFEASNSEVTSSEEEE